MNRTLFAFFVSWSILTGCKKNSTSNEIRESWKLTEVFDKSTSTTSYPPAGSGEIILTFINNNSFSGHTLKNIFTDGTFSKNGNQVTFGTFNMTKVAEDQWGGSFLTVLNACMLQSTMTCAPSLMTTQGNTLKIVSPLRYDITLERF